MFIRFIIINNHKIAYSITATMTQTHIRVNSILYICGPTRPGITRIFGKYYGSSTRIGSIGEVYSPGSETPYPDVHLQIVEVSESGVENVVFDATFNVKDFCISLVTEMQVQESFFSKEDMAKIQEHQQHNVDKIRAGTYCPLGEFDKMKLPGEHNVTVYFRALHRLGGNVEISSVSYISTV